MADWPTDKELEEIYRKGSEKHNFEYDPKAWDQMEVLLDKKKNRKSIFFILFGVLFLASTAMYFINNKPDANIKYSDINASKTEGFVKSKQSIDDSNYANETASLPTNSLSNNLSNNVENSAAKNVVEDSYNKREDKSVQKTRSSFQNKLRSNAPSNSLDRSEPQQGSRIASTPDFKSKSALGISNPNKVTKSPGLTSNRKEHLLYQAIPAIEILSFLTDGYLNLPEPAATTTYLEERMRNNSPIMLIAMLGAESSWTPTGEFSSIDYSLGLGLRGRLNDKFGYTIGASYIRDLYIANQGDYKASQDFWKQTEEPNYTSANCKMLEINTGISYYLNGWSHNGIGIHLDILSNFMLNEQYDYHFEEESMDFSSSWTRSNTTWLNAINIFPVYRFSYGEKGNIELGPYFKIPLSGIGHGDIMLSSFGIKGSVRLF